MRKVVYDVAVSVDGFIAGPADDVSGFLAEGDHVEAYQARLASYDTAIMGRRTYEFGYKYGLKPGDKPYPHMAHHVFSRRLQLPEGCGITVVRSDWIAAVDALKAGEGTDIYLCGGGEFAGMLLAAGRIDRLVVKVNPVLLGAGIPMFAGVRTPRALRPTGETVHASGVRLLEYDITN